MQGWSTGVSVGVLCAALAAGCGPRHTTTNNVSTSAGQGGEAAVAEGGDGGTVSTGATGQGAAAGSGASANGGSAGGPMLPPDGDVPPAVALHKLDLLLMIDNSRNTAEKQRLLSDAVAWLLAPAGGTSLAADDIHVGVITSSLGSHGAASAKDVCVTPDDDDHAHLLASVRPGVKSFDAKGFLAWGPEAGASATLDALVADLQPMLRVAGDTGCGYEASMEAWYRFLVDPEPPQAVVKDAQSSTAVLQGIDATILAQRGDFLRPDSVLAIVMLSDENDCSIQDEGYGWLISRAAPMYRSTSVCQTNPNDKCCQSCGEAQPNAGCPSIAADTSCQAGQYLNASLGEDDLNLRCWEQKRRFGFELLYPISRYTQGLTRQFQLDRNRSPVPNPIFAGQQRHPSQVILTGIVGVPWQDLATDNSLAGAGLTYLSPAELNWALMLGDPTASPPVLPTDPFMLETHVDRSTLPGVKAHPRTGDVLVGASSNDPGANAINGHESSDQGARDLQYACSFRLAEPKICDQAAFDSDLSCLCFAEDAIYNRAACQPPNGGAATITQSGDGAYPGLRHLQLLQSLGDTAITASACPKVLDDTSADYGYRPAMKALAARLAAALDP